MDFSNEKDITDFLNGIEIPFREEDWHELEKMLDNAPFDNRIAEKLKNFEASFTYYEWQIFDIALNNHTFDSHIQKALEDPEMELLVSDWENFQENRLRIQEEIWLRENLTGLSSLAGKPDFEAFEKVWAETANDYVFREKLNEPIFQETAADWLVLESELNRQVSDKKIREKLNAFSTTFVPADWFAFNKTLGQIYPSLLTQFKKRLPYSILLLFLIIGSYMGVRQIFIHKTETLPQAASHKVSESPQIPAADLTHHAPPIPQKQTAAKSSNLLDARNAQSHFQAQKQKTASLPPKLQNRMSIATPEPTLPKTIFINQEEEGGNKGLSLSTPEFPINLIIKEETNKKAQTQPNFIKISAQLPDTRVVRSLPTHLSGFIPDKHNSTLIEYGLYTSGVGTVVELKDDPRFGFQTGIRSILRLNENWGLIGDVLYTKRSFEHLYYKYSEYHETNRLNYLKGDVVSIDFPLMLRRTFLVGKHVAVYGQAGFVPSVTLSEDYLHIDPEKVNNLSWGDNDISKMIPTNQEINFQPYIGNLIAAVGVNIERERLNFSIEPKFQWCAQPMSMEQKRTYTVGVGVGMGYRFIKKSS